MAKVRRRFASLGYFGRKVFRRLGTVKPSNIILTSVIVGISLFLLGGGVYDILEKPLLAYPYGSNILYFYPGTQNQFGLESFNVMASYFMGAMGILLMYQSTKYLYKPRQAFIMLLIGALFILVAYFNIESLIWSKLTS